MTTGLVSSGVDVQHKGCDEMKCHYTIFNYGNPDYVQFTATSLITEILAQHNVIIPFGHRDPDYVQCTVLLWSSQAP